MAGVAVSDITPPVGILQQNWGSQTHVVSAGNDPTGMWVKVLVLSDGKGKFALVELDAVSAAGFSGAIARAAELTGIPAEHIRVSSSHTHAGPQLSPNRGPVGVDLKPLLPVYENHRRTVEDKLVGTIAEAASRLRRVHLHAARGAGSINTNRRFRAREGRPPAVGLNPEGFVDRDLLVVRIDDAEGNPYAVLFNYQCHGTVLAYENKFISPDWIGTARKVVEQALPGATALYLQGAAGNQGPVEGFTGDLQVPRRLGAILGHQAASLALAIDTVKRAPRFEGFVESTAYQAKQPWRVEGPRDSTLKFASRVLELPARTYSKDEIAEIARQVDDARKRAEEVAKSGDPWKTHQAQARERRLADLLKKWQSVNQPPPVKLLVRVLRIGDVAIVSMPGEPFAEIGAAVKKGSPFPHTMFTAYADGQGGGYMPVAEEYRFGGYEIQITPYAPEAAAMLVNQTLALLAEVRSQ
jgi:hypothetical protein